MLAIWLLIVENVRDPWRQQGSRGPTQAVPRNQNLVRRLDHGVLKKIVQSHARAILIVEDLVHIVIRADSDVAPADIRIGNLVFDLHIENRVHKVLCALNHNNVTRGLVLVLNDRGKTSARLA